MSDAMTSWTDNGLSWDDAESLRYVPVNWILEAIRGAIVERAAAAGVTPPTILSDALSPLAPTRDVTDAIQTAVTSLIPLFVNHADSDGDWTGLADTSQFAPLWTESTLLDNLEYTSRLAAPMTFEPFPLDWFIQQYRMLNQTLWIRRQVTIDSETNDDKSRVPTGASSMGRLKFIYETAGSPAAEFLAPALEAWNASSWTSEFSDAAIAWIEAYDYAAGGYWVIRLYRQSKTFQLNYNWTKGAVNVDMYAYLKNYVEGAEFSPGELGFTNQEENTAVRIFSGARELNGLTDIVTVGELDSAPFWPPDETGVTKRSWMLFPLYYQDVDGAIIKFNNENGFQFRDIPAT